MPFLFQKSKDKSSHCERPAAPAERSPAAQARTNAPRGNAGAAIKRGGSPGLVSSSTSGIPPDSIRVDPRESRLKQMRSRVLTGARLHVSQVSTWRAAMLTLTYAPNAEWDKRHVSECLRSIRQWLKRRRIDCRYVWVMELTKAGRPHYHLVVWLPWGMKLPFLDEKAWWPHGMTRMEWAKCAVGYVSKYVSKGDEKVQLPKGARMYSVGGLKDEALSEARWWALPTWLREQVEKSQVVRRNKGGGWLDRDSGEMYWSPWKVIFRHGEIWIFRTDTSSPSPGS